MKRGKIVASRQVLWAQKLSKLLFEVGALPRTPLRSLQRSPEIYGFQSHFAAGREKEQRKGKGQ